MSHTSDSRLHSRVSENYELDVHSHLRFRTHRRGDVHSGVAKLLSSVPKCKHATCTRKHVHIPAYLNVPATQVYHPYVEDGRVVIPEDQLYMNFLSLGGVYGDGWRRGTLLPLLRTYIEPAQLTGYILLMNPLKLRWRHY